MLHVNRKKKEKGNKMYTLSIGDDQLINWPVLVAPVWKIPTDDNRNLPCSEEWKTKYLVRDKEGSHLPPPPLRTYPKKQLRWQLWCVKNAFLNPLTARELDGVFEGVSNFWDCKRNPMMWPIKWKLSACTYTWCCLFFKILQNEICKLGRNLSLATFGSERVLLAYYFKVHFCCL